MRLVLGLLLVRSMTYDVEALDSVSIMIVFFFIILKLAKNKTTKNNQI